MVRRQLLARLDEVMTRRRYSIPIPKGWFHMNIFCYMDGVNVHMNMLDWYEYFLSYGRYLCSYEHIDLFMIIYEKIQSSHNMNMPFAHVNKDNDQNMWTYTTKSLCSYEHFCFSLRIKLTNQEELSLSIDCAFVIDM